MSVRVRFAPSPTGAMHVGNARTAIYNWLWAKHTGGQFLLRIEDTDAERSTPENVGLIFETLEWLGITPDAEPTYQSRSQERHLAVIEKLLQEDRAYYSTATKEDTDAYKEKWGHDRGFRGTAEQTGAVRLRVPDDGETVVHDVIRGDTTFLHRHLDDPVIARADGTPLYNLAAAIDDVDMEITHVIRGEDHLSNTARQLLVIEALGAPAPAYAHLPLIHGANGKKMGKRDGQNATTVQEFAAAGILPEALLNYLALLGWGTSDDETFLTPENLISRFDVADVSHNPARFDEKKLRWLNGLWIRHLDAGDLAERLEDYLPRHQQHLSPRSLPDLYPAAVASQEKIATLADFWSLVGPIYHPIDTPKARKLLTKDIPHTEAVLQAAHEALAEVITWDAEHIHSTLDAVLGAQGLSPGALYQPLRASLTGTLVSPGIAETLALISQEETLLRIQHTLKALASPSPSSKVVS